MTRGLVSILFAVGNAVGALAAPPTGALMDRFGVRKVLLATILLFSTGFLLFSVSQNVLTVFLVYVGVISLGFDALAYGCSTVVVNAWFNKYKSAAMAMLNSGTALGALIVVPILAFAIDIWSWRVAAALAGLIILLVGLPAVLFARNTPEEMGYEPDGIGGRTVLPPTQVQPTVSGLTAMQAMRTRTFWMLAGAVAAFGTTLVTVQIHFVPIMVWKGMDEVGGSLLVTLRYFVGIPMVITIGFMADRLSRLRVGIVAAILLAFGFAILERGNAVWIIWVATILMAPSLSLYALMWASVGDAFGRRSFATIRGIITAIQVVGILGVPILTGYIFEWTGAYTLALWMLAGIAALSAAFMALTPRGIRTVASGARPASGG